MSSEKDVIKKGHLVLSVHPLVRPLFFDHLSCCSAIGYKDRGFGYPIRVDRRDLGIELLLALFPLRKVIR